LRLRFDNESLQNSRRRKISIPCLRRCNVDFLKKSYKSDKESKQKKAAQFMNSRIITLVAMFLGHFIGNLQRKKSEKLDDEKIFFII
jgi:hypothetical protein